MPNRHTSAAQNPEFPGLEPDLRRVSVLLPLPLSGAYDYLVPDGLDLVPGDIVRVPLGPREVHGVVWERNADGEAEAPIARARLKEVRGRCDVPPLTEVARRFLEWLAAYSLSAPGSVLRMALNVTQALEPPRPVKLIAATGVEAGPELRLTAARRRVLAEAGGSPDGSAPARPLTELARAAGVSTSVIKGLQTAGLLEVIEVIPRADFAEPDWRRQGPELSPAQAQAAAALCDGLDSFSVTLLDGVTGSGKTEVYFEAIAAALAAGRQCLVMLPEIALSAQWLGRFVARFGVKPAQWHSDLSAVQRRVTWRAVAEGDARVVVGARSALFLPYRDLGLVVIDEEHDRAFKQEDGVVYHARDMAVVRARLGEIPIVLASATPSLETVVNVKTGRYARLHLPERHGQAELPEVRLVDLRQVQPARIAGLPGGGGQSWLSAALRVALGETLVAGEQALLFLNRRGYAPLTLCRACGHRLTCPQCTAWLVEHRLMGRLQCHHCGLSQPLPRQCPACDAEDSLVACGPGVERLAEELAALFPDARQAIMASDTMSGPAAVAGLVTAVEAREVDILIGTQVAAKGHHFPFLTLVGVIDADLGLYGGDLRAAERTFQILHQVAGRAGRAQHPGRVLIQTHDPTHPVMTALAGGDRDRFMEIEAATREDAGLPPFGRLAALVLSAPDARLVDEVAGLLARRAPTGEGVEVLGPAPAPLAVLRGRHRRRFLLRTRRDIAPQGVLQDWLGGFELPNQLRLRIDIDPYGFL